MHMYREGRQVDIEELYLRGGPGGAGELGMVVAQGSSGVDQRHDLSVQVISGVALVQITIIAPLPTHPLAAKTTMLLSERP
jgi:hypothetical protein